MFIKLPEEPTNTVKMVDDAGEIVPAQAAPKPRKRKKSSKK